jgi:hypothetical protein
MNIYLCNINESDISTVQYQSTPGSSVYTTVTVRSLDAGSVIYVDIPLDVLQQSNETGPLYLKVVLASSTVNVKLVYSTSYWNDEIDIPDIAADSSKIVYISDRASKIVRFKDLRKILSINADAITNTITQAFEE